MGTVATLTIGEQKSERHRQIQGKEEKENSTERNKLVRIQETKKKKKEDGHIIFVSQYLQLLQDVP